MSILIQKPRIFWLTISRRWICRIPFTDWLGHGKTPTEAYVNWMQGLQPWEIAQLRRQGRAP